MSAVLVAGVDEVGRGCLAGPVYAAAVILDPARLPDGLADSKRLSAARREVAATRIRELALALAVASAEVEEIERLNILGATLLAMRRAVRSLTPQPSLCLIDGDRLPALDCPARTLVGGDRIEPAIMAASIVAKVERDAAMKRLDRDFPGYGFVRHKGYGTAEHLAALNRLGPCRQHRSSFSPCRTAAERMRRAAETGAVVEARQ